MKKTHLFLASLFTCLPAGAATTYTYDFSSHLGAGQALSADGWSANSNWIANDFGGDRYARNQNDTDQTITRANDGGFSFNIPSGTTQVQLTISARSGTNWWEAGIAQDGTARLGIGGDYSNNKYFIFDNFTRRAESGASATGDTLTTLMLDFDLVAGTADLILDPGGANTLLINDVSMGVSTGALEAANRLFVRTNSRYAGPSEISITVIPEPAAGLIGGLGMLCLFRRRR